MFYEPLRITIQGFNTALLAVIKKKKITKKKKNSIILYNNNNTTTKVRLPKHVGIKSKLLAVQIYKAI